MLTQPLPLKLRITCLFQLVLAEITQIFESMSKLCIYKISLPNHFLPIFYWLFFPLWPLFEKWPVEGTFWFCSHHNLLVYFALSRSKDRDFFKWKNAGGIVRKMVRMMERKISVHTGSCSKSTVSTSWHFLVKINH